MSPSDLSIAEIVVADFTGKNPKVMYETGIAHSLGKHTIRIAQTFEQFHPGLRGDHATLYDGANSQGLQNLQQI